MKDKMLGRVLRVWRWALAALVLLCGVLLAVSCVRLCLSGEPFTRERVGAALSFVAPVLSLTVGAILVGAVLTLFSPSEEGEKAPVKHGSPCTRPALPPRVLTGVRLAVLAAGLLLVVLGILNGSMRDVLEKAVRICTECIGLG